MLFNWADKIVIQRNAASKLEKRAIKAKEQNFNDGLLMMLRMVGDRKFDFRFDVGPDDWKVPQHPDLLAKMRHMVENIPIEGEVSV
jgi:hypothetical protein